MKKLLIIILIFVIINPALAIETIQAPSWSEFCPEQFVNAEYIDINVKQKHQWKDMLYCGLFGVVGLLFCSSFQNKEKINTNNYWVSRRNEFESELSLCDNPKTDKSLCYLQVRQLELTKNNQLETQAMLKQQAYSQSMTNFSHTMQLQNLQNNQYIMQNQMMMNQFQNNTNNIRSTMPYRY